MCGEEFSPFSENVDLPDTWSDVSCEEFSSGRGDAVHGVVVVKLVVLVR